MEAICCSLWRHGATGAERHEATFSGDILLNSSLQRCTSPTPFCTTGMSRRVAWILSPSVACAAWAEG
jgi:hypothetical protein